MAISNIDASTSNFLDLLNSSAGDSYSVPPYQRSYAWEKEQWSDFWDDVISVVKEGDSHLHFMGAMVFMLHTDKSWLVLDGQQRFATLLLFLSGLRDAIAAKQEGQDSTETLVGVRNLIAPPVPGSYPKRRDRRLILNRRDDMRFNQILDGADVPKKATKDWHKSERQILTAYRFFLTKFTEELEGDTWEGASELAAAVERALSQQLCHIRVEIKDQVNAQAVFEALNNRGVELSQADLIKNYLFMEVESHPSDLKEAEDLWERTVNAVGEQDLAMFLRFYWNSAYDFVRMDVLQREMAKNVSSKRANVMTFARTLEKEAILFSALRSGEKASWIDRKTERRLAALKTLGLRTSYVLLLAMCGEMASDTEKRDAVKAVLSFSVRYFTVGGEPANTLEKQYSEWAREIRAKKRTATDMVGQLKSLGGSREVFLKRFEMLNVKDPNVAKYMLREINDAIIAERGFPKETEQTLELEHVIPQSLTEEWIQTVCMEDETINPEELIYRFGNLTLLEKQFNIAGSNHDLDTKRTKAYDLSILPTNEDLKSTASEPYASFGPAEVLSREKRFAAVAERTWTV
jgi:Protein of unknown function DUF262/Protein of unknown function (DUF1524)